LNNAGSKSSGQSEREQPASKTGLGLPATGDALSPRDEQFYPELRRFLINRLRNGEDAQDIAQEAFLRLLRVKRTELIRQPRAYLYRIAVNLVSEYRLREQRELIMFDSDTLDALSEEVVDPSTDFDGQHASELERIEALLANWPPLYRAIFVLRKRDGLSYQEIASELNISIHTVKKYLARSLALCRHAKSSR
jgi:RNA polymerase sigma factor (sigma-70 family)